MTSGESSSFFTCMSYIYRYEIPEIRKLDGSIDRSEVYGESSITNKGGKAFAPILSLFISSSRDEIVRQGTNLPLPSALNSFFFFFHSTRDFRDASVGETRLCNSFAISTPSINEPRLYLLVTSSLESVPLSPSRVLDSPSH